VDIRYDWDEGGEEADLNQALIKAPTSGLRKRMALGKEAKIVFRERKEKAERTWGKKANLSGPMRGEQLAREQKTGRSGRG